jgi:hypothetical protein
MFGQVRLSHKFHDTLYKWVEGEKYVHLYIMLQTKICYFFI